MVKQDRQPQDALLRKADTAVSLTQPGQMQAIYHRLTGRSYTRRELTQTLPIRLIAVFQSDGSLLLEPYNSEWMAQRWSSIVQYIEVEGDTQHGGDAIVHLAGDNLAGQALRPDQLRTLIASAQAHLRRPLAKR